MNSELLNTEIQTFIDDNLTIDTSKILLKGTSFPNVNTHEIVEQIEAKLKSRKKLPTWFSTKNIYFSNKLNIEQTSSEITAAYKTSVLKGRSIVDITGGFGVDTYYFSKVFESVTHCEISTDLAAIVSHNVKKLKAPNIEVIPLDGIKYVESSTKKYDWIYVDPSRRHDTKGKVFFLNDCLPNIPAHLNALLKSTNQIAIKTSPLLDISIGISELQHVKEVHIIAVKNEVKELLWIIENGFIDDIKIHTVNLIDIPEHFSMAVSKEAKATVRFELPSLYLYEPNASILKSGAFNTVAQFFNIAKLHQHSHLYTSDTIINFPGRTFNIESVVNYNKKSLKNLAITKANITTRNFPESVQSIRKKYRIKDGGKVYLFFTTNYLEEKIVIVCSKVL
ncbi:MAG: class I SAM-dependent methyltransferase [Psychroserpens sp.]|uniref:class I SAM-dependent methyltransferase n=1 Tax=Psychroserpens sp. TaxID=2020870 RepID=UPI003C778D9D